MLRSELSTKPKAEADNKATINSMIVLLYIFLKNLQKTLLSKFAKVWEQNTDMVLGN